MAAAAVKWQQTSNLAPYRSSGESSQAVVITNPHDTVGLLEDEKFEVEETTTPVYVNGYYNRTNHCIHQSREYVGGAKLTRYINFPALFILSVVVMLVSLAAPGYYVVAFIMAGIDFAWFCIFVQHMYVNVRTMPHMLRLPRVPDNMMQTHSGFFEITLEKYSELFGVQAQAGIGIIVAEKGTIQLHILTYKAVCYMKVVMVYSTFALLATFALMIYCTVFGIVGVTTAAGGDGGIFSNLV